ncbi:uncharacterized protein [Haliotis cracherodii]|uniref:uncharacterized protein n=1 Tax=Haliotis cracherodii TaxID=6455 RepID=UPI0039EB6BED
MLFSTTATTTVNAKTKPKPPRRRRRHFTTEQLETLETNFTKHDGYIDLQVKQDLVEQLDVDEATVSTWFCNRRAKLRRQTKPTSLYTHPVQSSEIKDKVAPTSVMETKAAKPHRKLIDLSNLQPKQNIINTGRCFELRKKSQCQQSGQHSKPCHKRKRSRTTETREPEVETLASGTNDLVGRSEKLYKENKADVNFNGPQGKPKPLTHKRLSLPGNAYNQILTEAYHSGMTDKQTTSPPIVYNIQTFSPSALPRILPMKDTSQNSHVSHFKSVGSPNLPNRRQPTKLKRILPKPHAVVSLSPAEGQAPERLPQDDDSSQVPPSNEQISSRCGYSPMSLPHVPMQPVSESVMSRGQVTVVPDKENVVHQSLPCEITLQPREQDPSLNNCPGHGVGSVECPQDTDTEDLHPGLDEASYFSAMCEIDIAWEWNPLPDDVAVMFHSYRESPDCAGGVDITDTTEAESEAIVVEKNIQLPSILR